MLLRRPSTHANLHLVLLNCLARLQTSKEKEEKMIQDMQESRSGRTRHVPFGFVQEVIETNARPQQMLPSNYICLFFLSIAIPGLRYHSMFVKMRTCADAHQLRHTCIMCRKNAAGCGLLCLKPHVRKNDLEAYILGMRSGCPCFFISTIGLRFALGSVPFVCASLVLSDIYAYIFLCRSTRTI